jgi:hypothetical protein
MTDLNDACHYMVHGQILIKQENTDITAEFIYAKCFIYM